LANKDKSMTLSTLRARLETATEANQAEVLEMAFHAFIPKPISPHITTDTWNSWAMLYCKFRDTINVEAYTDAALLIMREVLPEWSYSIIDEHTSVMHHPIQPSMDARAGGRSTPLAIIAAICAAKGDGDA
jgi:hypothetical protein